MLSPDGRRVLTLSSNNDVMVWDIFSGSQVFSEPLKHDELGNVTFSPDGEKLVTYDSRKSQIQVWDTRTGRRLIEPFRISNVNGILFPKNGECLIAHENTRTTAGNAFSEQTSGRFHLLDLSVRPVVFESLTEVVVSAPAARFTPEGTRVVVCARSRPDASDQISVWDATTRQLQQTIPFPPNVFGVTETLQISPDGRRAAVGCSDGPVRVWDLSRGELLHELAAGGNVSSSDLSRDGALLATGTQNGKVQVWNFNTGAALFGPLDHGTVPITSLSFSQDGRLLASGSQDFKLRVVDAKTGAQRFAPVPLPSIINALPFSSDNQAIAAAPFSEEIFIIEASTGRVVRKLPHLETCRVSRFSPDGSILAVGTGGNLNRPVGQVYLWNWREGTLIGSPLEANGAVQYLEFSDDGAFLAIGTLHSVGTVQVWGVGSGRAMIEPVEERSQVASFVDFNPSATQVVACWKNGIVRLIDLPPRGTSQPGWLPALAEAVAGQRLTGSGGIESVLPQELDVLREKLAGSLSGSDDAFSAWARWLVRDSGERTISAASKVPFRDHVGRLRNSSKLEDLQEALRLNPSDAVIHARIGRVLLDSLPSASELDANKDVSARLRALWEETAAWYGGRAVQIEPGNAEASALHAEVLRRLRVNRLFSSGTSAYQSGRSADAIRDLEQVRDDLRAIRRAEPANDRAARQLGLCLSVLGKALRNQRRSAEAMASFKEARDVRKTMGKPSPVDLYDLACIDAQNAALVEPAQPGSSGRQAIADRAMEALRLSIAADSSLFSKIDNDHDLDALRERADFRALMTGRFREIVPHIAMMSAADPNDTALSLKVAALQAWFGQEKEFAETRKRILAFAKGTKEPTTAERAAKACSTMPYSDKGELDAALVLARTALKLDHSDEWEAWGLLALGMAEYRSGDYPAAEKTLLAATEAGSNNTYVPGISAFYRAMSLARLGKADEARKVAIAATTNMKPLPADDMNPLARNATHDDVILWLAYKEAKALIQFHVAPPKSEDQKN
jgi:WD40 repeat protein/tetratricopeptide (TPR) repeat protein